MQPSTSRHIHLLFRVRKAQRGKQNPGPRNPRGSGHPEVQTLGHAPDNPIYGLWLFLTNNVEHSGFRTSLELFRMDTKFLLVRLRSGADSNDFEAVMK